MDSIKDYIIILLIMMHVFWIIVYVHFMEHLQI